MLNLILRQKLRCVIPFGLLLATAGLLLGCGSGGDAPQRRIVEGTVSYEGEPLVDGVIRFLPQPQGPVTTAIISGGKYKAENKGGVSVGKVRVEIEATESAALANQGMPSPDSPAVKQVKIPAKYNVESTLEQSIEAGGDIQQIDFSLTR